MQWLTFKLLTNALRALNFDAFLISLAFESKTHLVLFLFCLLIFARKNKPCPVKGMTFVQHFAEVLTIDIAQLAVARKAGFAVSYHVPPNATHLRPYREPL
jgi:hypothetical protein